MPNDLELIYRRYWSQAMVTPPRPSTWTPEAAIEAARAILTGWQESIWTRGPNGPKVLGIFYAPDDTKSATRFIFDQDVVVATHIFYPHIQYSKCITARDRYLARVNHASAAVEAAPGPLARRNSMGWLICGCGNEVEYAEAASDGTFTCGECRAVRGW